MIVWCVAGWNVNRHIPAHATELLKKFSGITATMQHVQAPPHLALTVCTFLNKTFHIKSTEQWQDLVHDQGCQITCLGQPWRCTLSPFKMLMHARTHTHTHNQSEWFITLNTETFKTTRLRNLWFFPLRRPKAYDHQGMCKNQSRTKEKHRDQM